MVLMVSLRIHVLKDKTLVDRFHLNVPEFQVGNSALPRGKPTRQGARSPVERQTPATYHLSKFENWKYL
jgi:hypothetical protein